MDAKLLNELKPGDVIAFSGRGLASDFINVATFGIPRWSISHVGIIVESHFDRETTILESTSSSGVRMVWLSAVLNEYSGHAWVYPLSRDLFGHEKARLFDLTSRVIDLSYDMAGALRSGGGLWSWVQAVARGEDLTSLFCSELVAHTLSEIGLFPTSNASRWSPNHLVRRLRRMGIVDKPKRLK